MSQDASMSTDGPIDFHGTTLREVDDVPGEILRRELKKVVAAARTSSQAMAGFNSRLRTKDPWPEPGARPAIEPGTGAVAASIDEK